MTFPQAIPQFCSVPIQVGKRGKKVKWEKNWATWQILPLLQSFWKRYFFLFLTAAAKAVAEGTSKFIR